MAVHAALTPGMARTLSTSDSGTGSRSGRLLAWAAKRAVERMMTSDVPVSADARWNEASMVSVRMNVPETRVTASATASAVPKSRPPCAAAPRSRRNTSAAKVLHVVDRPLGGRLEHLVDDLAVGQEHDPVGVGGGHGVMRHHHDGLAEGVDGLAHEGQELAAGLGVEVARRLVGEDDLGPGDQGAGRRHPLLLTTGELRGPVPEAPTQADAVD